MGDVNRVRGGCEPKMGAITMCRTRETAARAECQVLV